MIEEEFQLTFSQPKALSLINQVIVMPPRCSLYRTSFLFLFLQPFVCAPFSIPPLPCQSNSSQEHRKSSAPGPRAQPGWLSHKFTIHTLFVMHCSTQGMRAAYGVWRGEARPPLAHEEMPLLKSSFQPRSLKQSLIKCFHEYQSFRAD